GSTGVRCRRGNEEERRQMSVWVDNAWLSAGLGALAFVVLLVPGLVWQYRRHGAWSPSRMLGWAMVCLYFAALLVYTLLPLPENGASWCAAHTVRANVRPFAFLEDIRRETAGLSLRAALRSAVVLQVVFNVVLFVPLGTNMRRSFGRGVVAGTLIGAGVSLLIEFSQYTGLFGAYPCAYRVADVDDVLTNTVGALLGALIAPALLWWMPDARALAAKRLQPRPVTSWRRWTGMMLDVVATAVISSTVGVALQVARWVVGEHPVPPASTWEEGISTAVAVLVVFLLPAWRNRGASLGQTIVWLTPKWVSPDGTRLTDASVARRTVRSLVVVGPWVLAPGLRSLSEDVPAAMAALLAILAVICGLVPVVALVMVPFTRTHRSLSGVLTGAVFLDAREAVAGGPTNSDPSPLEEADRVRLGVRGRSSHQARVPEQV
ncbi:MAG: VanZ family protein, partial [Propionibacterium sp.]|nr:VanZ family protein [Propionibacterium sp.]